MRAGRAATAFATSLLSFACSPAATGAMVPPSDVPHVRPGFWEEVWVFNGKTTPTRKFCDVGQPIFPPRTPDCTEYSVVRTGPRTLVLDSTCKAGGTTTMHRVVSGDFASAYTADGTMEVTGLMRAVVHESYRYLGACPAGLTPER